MGDQSPALASDRHIQFKVLGVGFIIPGNPLNVLDSVARASLSHSEDAKCRKLNLNLGGCAAPVVTVQHRGTA